MNQQHCILLGAPVESGGSQPGCRMGPDSLRVAGLADVLGDLGFRVTDRGNVAPAAPVPVTGHRPGNIRYLSQALSWMQTLEPAARDAAEGGAFPIFMGGDHSIALGTVPGVAAARQAAGQPLFVLWLDAHTDFHTLETSASGNLHGVPLAYFTGRSGFAGAFPPPAVIVPPERVCLMGIRSVDPAERIALADSPLIVHDMRDIDEHGVRPLLRRFMDRVVAADGIIHLSIDVDFLDPDIAPAVGTTVPGGATFREAHLIMEMLHDSGRVGSLDLVELNPFLDKRGRTARLLVDLTASLFGRRVLDRPTGYYQGAP